MEVSKSLQQMTRRTEFFILIVLVVMCVIIQVLSGGQFFQANSIVDISRSITIIGMFALCSLMVVVSGGFDLSFPALASLSYSAATTICLTQGWCQDSPVLAFVIAGAIGLGLGMLNGVIISRFRLNVMIVTLGTQTLFLGMSVGLFQFREITSTLPQGLKDFGQMSLFEVTSANGIHSAMPVAFLFFVALAVVVWFVLKYTMFGRALFAIGGNEVSAERAGFNVKRTKFWLYAMVGLMCALIGMLRVCMVRQAIPKGLNGWELQVIPIVILGGASIYGGEGTVLGTLAAVSLITVISNSLLLIGIDSYWQSFFNGLIILIGVTISAVQAMRRNK